MVNNQVVRLMGKEKIDSFYLLFVAPGMAHCGGGVGPDSFGQPSRGNPPIVDGDHDLLTAIAEWVEEGKAPDSIVASKVDNGQVVITRPLCPYPQVTRYQGKGDNNDASSFVCTEQPGSVASSSSAMGERKQDDELEVKPTHFP